ncbi:MAG TPA: hypothetical protein VKE70_28210 [Candidatus Solibacter sp.]|nr:hypothetical protein [Candidatus Solibacter sp.]
MKHFPKFFLTLAGGLLLSSAFYTANADEWNKKTYITIGQSIEVPGAILPPGRYVFKLLDSQSNRHIVQVMNDRENHVYCTNLAIPKERMEPADKTILTFYEMPGGGPEPVRAWFYPGDLIGQEFVYPKRRMAEIRAAMEKGRITVAENRTTVETPPPAVVEEKKTETVEEAPAPTPTPAPPPVAEEQAPTPAPAPPPEQPAPAPEMPHTAGNTIEIGILGLMCIGLAVSLRIANGRLGSGS